MTWEGARCFVSGGTAQTRDIPAATAQDKEVRALDSGSESRTAKPSRAVEMRLQHKDNCQRFTAIIHVIHSVSGNTCVCALLSIKY